jgi:hypothetical protein
MERHHSEDQGIDGRMKAEWILERLAGGASGSNWLRIGIGSCEYGDESSGSGTTELVS